MSRIVWGDVGQRLYEVGIDRGVLYAPGADGVPWNGLTEVLEKPSGGSATPYYYDGLKYLNVSSLEEYEATLSAFTYPDEFMVCDGTLMVDTGLFIAHQPRQPFSFTYRTMIGNEVESTDLGYKIHLIYNALAEPTQRENKTLSDSPEPMDFSWDITVLPPIISGYRSSGHLIIDTRSAHPGMVTDLETALYGSDSTDPRMPGFDEVAAMVSAYADFTVTDNGNGTWRLTAPASALTDNGNGTYEFNSDAATLSGDTFVVGTTA